MREMTERLVVASSHARFRLPSLVIADDDHANLLLCREPDDVVTRFVERILDSQVALQVQTF